MDGSNIYMLPIVGVIGEDFKYPDVLMHLNAAKKYNVIKLLIDSPGGYIDEGEKIRQALVDSGKVFFSTNIGDVASYAVSLFLIAPNRTYDSTKGTFLIHMPFVPHEDGVSGTAQEIEAIAKDLKKLQDNLVKQYTQITGTERVVIEGFMNENKPLTPEQVQSLGFARLENQKFKAVAYFKNENNMTNEEVTKKLGVIESLVNKVMNFIKPKALMIQDATGTELDFGDAVQTPEQIVVGVKATVNGTPADGDYTMPDGSVLTFEAGILTVITPAAPGPNEELEALKAENKALKAQIEASTKAQNEIKTEFTNFKMSAEKQIKEVQTKFTDFKNQFSDGTVPGNTPGGESPKSITKAQLESQFGINN